MAKEIPYLEDAEECEEIFYDDCLEVTESIPGNPRPQAMSVFTPQYLHFSGNLHEEES